jgi:hypothetical protein
MNRVLVIFFCAAVGLSCASTRTPQEVHNASALRSVKTLAIGPYNATETALAVYEKVYTPFDTTIFNLLTRSGRFQTIIPHDTMCGGIDVRDRNAAGTLLGRAEARQADALLLCTLDIVESSFRSVPLHDAAVTLVLISTTDSTVMLDTRFRTQVRGEYFFLPEYSRVTHDAAEGAVKQLLKACGAR